MYENIGKKIKSLAKVLGYALAGITALVGISFAFNANDEEFIVIILLVTVLVALLEIISTWVLYGFGQLVESVQHIENAVQSGSQKSSDLASVLACCDTESAFESADEMSAQKLEVSLEDKERMQRFLQSSQSSNKR